jgi:teichuronic acid biosynthesis glycosyltransferase TuaG
MPKISVIIPTYNRRIVLKSAIESVLSQTHPVDEILICDDGSTDKTLDMVKEFSDPRVRWIAGERGGRPAIPRNRGIKESEGDWLAFLDSDDSWHPNKIKAQLALLTKYNVKAACSNAVRLTPGASTHHLYFDKVGPILNFLNLLEMNQVICSSALVHRSIVQEIGYFPEELEFRAIEDYSFWLKVATHTDWVCCEEGMVNYFDDPGNSIRNEGYTEEEQREIILRDYIKWNDNIYPSFYDAAIRALAGKPIKGGSFSTLLKKIASKLLK